MVSVELAGKILFHSRKQAERMDDGSHEYEYVARAGNKSIADAMAELPSDVIAINGGV